MRERKIATPIMRKRKRYRKTRTTIILLKEAEVMTQNETTEVRDILRKVLKLTMMMFIINILLHIKNS